MNKEIELSKRRIVFLDLETTGLSALNDKILEAGVVITDGDLQVVAELPSLVIHRTAEELGLMNLTCKNMHKSSGLIDEIEESILTQNQVESILLRFLKDNAIERRSPLAGFSVHFDYKFLEYHMPMLYNFFPHQLLDVSSLIVASRIWSPKIEAQIMGNKRISQHRSYQDCLDAINVLKLYRENIFP